MIPIPFHVTTCIVTLTSVSCVSPGQCWFVLPVTLQWTSWRRRSIRPDSKWSDCAPRAERPLTRPCRFWLCTTRRETWTGNTTLQNQFICICFSWLSVTEFTCFCPVLSVACLNFRSSSSWRMRLESCPLQTRSATGLWGALQRGNC